jgi:co-chaperonin GroES (HSP10)
MIPLRILGPKVLVALEPKGTEVEAVTGMNYHDKGRTDSGIILAQPTDMYDADDHSRGLVVALGEKKGVVELEAVKKLIREDRGYIHTLDRLDRLTPAPFDVEVGDVVLFSPAAGISLGEQDDGVTYVLLQETDIQAVIQPKEAIA